MVFALDTNFVSSRAGSRACRGCCSKIGIDRRLAPDAQPYSSLLTSSAVVAAPNLRISRARYTSTVRGLIACRLPVPAAVALEQLARAVADDIVIGASAARAAKAIRPTGMPHRHGALRLGAEAAKELGDRPAAQELDQIECHGARSIVRRA